MIPVLPIKVDQGQQGVKCGRGKDTHMTWQPNVVTFDVSAAAWKISIWHLRISTANLSHFKSFNTFFGASKTQNIYLKSN